LSFTLAAFAAEVAEHVHRGCQEHLVAAGDCGAPSPGNTTAPDEARSPRPASREAGRAITRLVPAGESVHNELLGGHGDDMIHAGPAGDDPWAGDKPSGQPTSQRDVSWAAPDATSSTQATARTRSAPAPAMTGSRPTSVAAPSAAGLGDDLLSISRRARRGYRVTHCERISHRTPGH